MGARKEGVYQVDDVEVLALRFDSSNDPLLYLAEASPGSLTSESVWRIARINVAVGVAIQWANGNNSFVNVWDDRASLTYI